MKKFRASLPAGVLFACLLGIFQVTTFGQAPEAPPRTSQLVHEDGSITFRYIDSGAAKVELVLENTKDPLPMTKDAGGGISGLWSVTTAPLPPEIYGYSFVADGQTRLDPFTPMVAGNPYFSSRNGIEVPGPGPMPWDKTNVPHGEVTHHLYTTQVAVGIKDNQSEYVVYTPPGYDPNGKKSYPVLYLLHGWSGMSDSWTAEGKANLIFDNLIAQGKAKPMVVVMPLGYGDMAFLKDYGLWGNDEAIDRNVNLFTQVLLTEIIPRIETEYRVSKEKKNRAITGLSMGGIEALSIGLKNTDKFAYVGGFSGAVHREAFLKGLPVLTPKVADLKLLWVACGTGDGLIEPNRKLVAHLKAENMPVTAIETPGMHVWQVWRDNLVNFAPLLFQK